VGTTSDLESEVAPVAPLTSPSDIIRSSPVGRQILAKYITGRLLTVVLTVSAASSYGLLWRFDSGFLEFFGTTPEEVGISRDALIIRAAVYGIILVAVMTFLILASLAGILAVVYAVIGFFGVMYFHIFAPILRSILSSKLFRQRLVPPSSRGRFSPTQLWLNSTTKTLWLAGGLTALVTALWTLLSYLGDRQYFTFSGQDTTAVLGFFGVFLIPAAFWNKLAALALAALVTAGLALACAGDAGAILASSVNKDAVGATTTLDWFALEAQPVQVIATESGEVLPKQAIYLGKSGATFLLYSDGTLYRANDVEVIFNDSNQ
jgi:hypothetical protein